MIYLHPYMNTLKKKKKKKEIPGCLTDFQNLWDEKPFFLFFWPYLIYDDFYQSVNGVMVIIVCMCVLKLS